MDNSLEHEAGEGHMDHGLRDIDPLFVIANGPFPARHPTESTLGYDSDWFRQALIDREIVACILSRANP